MPDGNPQQEQPGPGLSEAGSPAPAPSEPDRADIDALIARFQAGDPAAAMAATDLAARHLNSVTAQQLAGLVVAGSGDPAGAVPLFARAAALCPDRADIHVLHGSALLQAGQAGAAVAALRAALARDPHHAEALGQLGLALHHGGDAAAAAEALHRAAALQPHDPGLLNNLGVVLHDLGRCAEAADAYRRALALRPEYADALANLGTALKEQGLAAEAVAACERALALDADHADAWATLGAARGDLGETDAAVVALRRAQALRPGHAPTLALSIEYRTRVCDWSAHADFAAVAPWLGIAGEAVSPFAMLALDDNAARHRQRVERFAQGLPQPPAPAPAAARPRAPGERIRVGYFSADFHDHATMHLLAGLLREHDRSRFEIVAFGYGPDFDDAMRRHVIAHVDRFHAVHGWNNAAIAALARAQPLDIAVDLKGHTQGSRIDLLAGRLAPVQISYLGYPGPLGLPYIDYIVADRVVIPPEHRSGYGEAVLFLPDSYQANDSLRPVAPAPARGALGLPEGAFVFACFNQCYKIGPAEFDVWMRLLHAVPGSVLGLFRSGATAEANLRREAAARGIDPARLVFAPWVPHAEHLGRIARADLFLDTFACNAHTTASDALWAGLPLVTLAGQSFAARVAASLLHAVGLPDCVAESADGYAALALALATDPARLAAVRARLAANRLTAPLFDSRRFARVLETGYGLALERAAQGLPPADIVVPAP